MPSPIQQDVQRNDQSAERFHHHILHRIVQTDIDIPVCGQSGAVDSDFAYLRQVPSDAGLIAQKIGMNLVDNGVILHIHIQYSIATVFDEFPKHR